MRSTLIAALLCLCATSAAAQGSGNKGQVEWSFGLPYYLATSTTTEYGSSIDFSARLGFQFGVDYYLIDRLAIGFDMSWVRPDYSALLIPDDGSAPIEIRHQANIWNGQFNFTYNFTDRTVTPYVEAGLGWTNFDSNVADSPPTTGCWWTPWGYMCSNFYSTYSSSNFSYGAGLGLRWNVNYDMSVKLGYRIVEIDTGSASEKPTMDSVQLELAYHF
ncbi:MAG: outer membrane beta-barrel protein [Gammaproteobacteria bacterium]|jgi:opacity protein-like surface antigen|nr:outer membrane beta-barrel protein [Gammaproteobacteria bacterium]